MRNLNRSMELESYSNDKKVSDFSKSALSFSVKNINNKIEKKENITENTQSSSRNIYNTIQSGNKRISKNNIKAIIRRNKDSDLNDNKKISKSFVNIKETDKNCRTFRKENNEKTKKKYNRNSEKNIFTNNKNVEKFLTKRK